VSKPIVGRGAKIVVDGHVYRAEGFPPWPSWTPTAEETAELERLVAAAPMRCLTVLPCGMEVRQLVTPDPSWLSDERIREIKHGDDATRAEVLALAGECRERRRDAPSAAAGDVSPAPGNDEADTAIIARAIDPC
jgi:hypothetical protein